MINSEKSISQEPVVTDTSDFQLLPDDYFEEDETIDHETLFQDIKAGMEEALAWERDETALRTTILTDDGRRIGPEMMTHAQQQEKLRELEAAPAAPLNLLGELLKWAGRPAATPEENAEVDALRRRVEEVLETAGFAASTP